LFSAGDDVNVVPLQIQVNGKSVPIILAILFGAVLFVLLIACAIVANLLLARGVAPGQAVQVRLSYLDRLSNQVTIGVK
jgi:hypothetical protein